MAIDNNDIGNESVRELNRWISFTCLHGDVFIVRRLSISTMFGYPCSNPNECQYPVHYMLCVTGKDVPVSKDEFMRVARELGIDTSTIPEVREGVLRAENVLAMEVN